MNPVLILLHGALGSERYFTDLKSRLRERFEIHTLNFEGHGGRTSNQPFSIDLFANNLIDYLNDNNLSKVSVFGYSMGGYVALTVAHKSPHLIDRIVTLGTKFSWSPEIAAKEVRMLNPEKIEEKVPKFATQLAALHHPADWKEVMHKTADLMLGLGGGNGLTDEQLQNVNITVTLGVGDKDHMVGLAETQRIANLLPNATLCVLPNVPHPIEMVDLNQLDAYISQGIK